MHTEASLDRMILFSSLVDDEDNNSGREGGGGWWVVLCRPRHLQRKRRCFCVGELRAVFELSARGAQYLPVSQAVPREHGCLEMLRHLAKRWPFSQ